MVDVSEKASTAREAVAEGRLIIAAETAQLIREERTPKGAVLTTAEIAGIMAAKRTADLIPMCHPLALTSVKVLTTLEDSAVRVAAGGRHLDIAAFLSPEERAEFADALEAAIRKARAVRG
jgi:molybdenum cofactor biosynthesis protein MoaC